MSNLPPNLKRIAFFLQRLPGIGEKTAKRLSFYFLRMPDEDLKAFAESIRDLKETTKKCTVCFNLTENDICFVCENSQRDPSIITVVEDVIDLLSFETGNIYNGYYHVLHGKIDPLNNIGPDEIFINQLVERAKKNNLKEIILATNFDMEGEATAMYIKNQLNGLGKTFKITRLAYGLPIGGNLEYADYLTLKKAIEGRNEF